MPNAKLALNAGSAVSSGLDGFIFTGGIGEHAAQARATVRERLRWLGVALDADPNARKAGRISTADSRVEVRVMGTDEEATIAGHMRDLLR